MNDDRTSLCCRRCRLTQYLTSTGHCRKCYLEIDPPKAKAKPTKAALLRAKYAPYGSVAFGQRALFIRTARGLTQLEVSKAAGVPRSYVSRLENGVVGDLGAGMFVRLCLALDIHPQHFLMGL